MYEVNNVAYALPQSGDDALEAFPGAWRDKRMGRDEALGGILKIFLRGRILHHHDSGCTKLLQKKSPGSIRA